MCYKPHSCISDCCNSILVTITLVWPIALKQYVETQQVKIASIDIIMSNIVYGTHIECYFFQSSHRVRKYV